MNRRYEIGTITDGNFEADTLGNDPDLTTFDSEREAIRECAECISSGMFDGPLTDCAVRDSATNRIVWMQATR